MSFRVAQDHNNAAGRDTTLLTASSTRRDYPAATTQCHSSCFGFACPSFSFYFACHELYCIKVVELVFLLLVINNVVDFMMCVNYIGVVRFIPI
jgi:hypothetical protein